MNNHMTNFEFKHSLQPGDVVVRNKSVFGIIGHYGLYVGNGEVIDNHPNRGVSLINLNAFLSGRGLKRIARFNGNSFARSQAVNKGYSMLGMKYHLTKFNCEHFVNEAWGAGKKSQQVATSGTLFFLFLAIWGLSKVN